VQNCGQLFQIPFERSNRSSQHLRPAHLLPFKGVAIFSSEQLKKFPLGAAIAIAKGMERIQFTQIKSGPRSEHIQIESDKMSFTFKPLEDGLSCAHYISMVSKEVVALTDIHSSKLARPLIHIAK